MKWGMIFENYILACYEMYRWIVGAEKAAPFSEFDERMFYNSLIEKGYMNNEERVLEFFDIALIECYILPLAFKCFKSVASSEYRMMICNDHPNRREAALKTLENAFDLLHERHKRQQKQIINNTLT